MSGAKLGEAVLAGTVSLVRTCSEGLWSVGPAPLGWGPQGLGGGAWDVGSVGAVVRLDQHGWVLSTQHPLLLVLQGTSQRQEAPKSEAKVGELRAGSGEVEGEGQTGGSF